MIRKTLESVIPFAALLAAVFLAACTTAPTISNSATSNVIAKSLAPAGGQVSTGIQNAAWNLDQSIAIGVLPADDEADACVHSALRLAGLESIPGAPAVLSFTPKVSDAISAGSVLYIQAKQARSQTPFQVSAGCKAILGGIVLDGLAATAGVATSLIPGTGSIKALITR